MMNKKFLPHIISAVSIVVFIVLGQGSGASSPAVKSAASVDELTDLRDKFDWIKANAESGDNYVLDVLQDASLGIRGSFAVDISFKNKSNITITLKGIGGNRTITTYQRGGLFCVGSGVTLILDDNITLKGISSGMAPNVSLVGVLSGGTLIMNEGSKITGHGNDGNGGGVYVSKGGTFLMNGGTIIGNFSCYTIASAQHHAAGQALVGSAVPKTGLSSGNTSPAPPIRRGGGVYVDIGGTFTKTGGTIAGLTHEPSYSNAVIDPNVRPISDSGHAVYAAMGKLLGILVTDMGEKRKETTAGPNNNLHIGSDGTFSGDWDF